MTYKLDDSWRKLSLRELQLLQLDVMKIIHSVCVENGIKYYLIAGSLLGAVRHGGFIPWDDDIDIAMMREDYERFKLIFPKVFDTDKFFLQHASSDKDFQPSLMRLCIKGTYQDVPSERQHKNCKNSYIDIFPLDNVPNSDAERKRQYNDLNRLNSLIERKLYHVYSYNSRFKRITKIVISKILKLIPLSYLQNRREMVMTRHDAVSCDCVCSMASKYGYRKQIMPKSYYGQPKLFEFEDCLFYVPERVETYLNHLYGEDYMALPPENKRVKPHDVYIKENDSKN